MVHHEGDGTGGLRDEAVEPPVGGRVKTKVVEHDAVFDLVLVAHVQRSKDSAILQVRGHAQAIEFDGNNERNDLRLFVSSLFDFVEFYHYPTVAQKVVQDFVLEVVPSGVEAVLHPRRRRPFDALLAVEKVAMPPFELCTG